MNAKAKIKDCMIQDVITAKPDSNITEVVELLIKNKISGMPVIDDDRNVVGIISEQDCLKPYVESRFHEMPTPQVKHVMSTSIKSVKAEDSVLGVASFFLDSPFRRLAVVEDGKLVGQVSRRDILRVLGT